MQYIPIRDYNYDLPEEKIAKYPLESRDSSKLLVYENGGISTDAFFNLDKHLPSNSLMVYNDTKVIQARLFFKKKTGSIIEIFCLEPHKPSDYYNAFRKEGSCEWKCLVGNLKKWKEDSLKEEFFINDDKIVIEVLKKESHKEWNIIQFKWEPAKYCFGEILESFGKTPIPPYLNRPSEPIDRLRYQTIYSSEKGSVAAPTAGLHFLPSLFEKMDNKQILSVGLTLHVGAGTFIPVKENNAALHKMHSEPFIIKKELIQHLLDYDGNVTAIGTTSLRALESMYWAGVKILENKTNPLIIEQWEAYQLSGNYPSLTVFRALLEYSDKNSCDVIYANTKLMIVPGYRFRVVQRLITNFHQPSSTLLMLVAAFVGESHWKIIYQYALENEFRFLSYGDSSLLIR